MKRRLLYISSTAVSHQVQLCNEMQKYYTAEFWFYEGPERTRGSWWRVALGDHCRILSKVLFARDGIFADRYIARGLKREIEAFDPDILMLGGFSIPGNMLAYRWAKKAGKRTVVFTERSRDSRGNLRRRKGVWRLLSWIYRDVDLVITCAEDVVPQFRDEFKFGDKVVAGRYAMDLDGYLDHPLRTPKSAYTYLFANRLTAIYGPHIALDVFARIVQAYPQSRLLMNAAGELRSACEGQIKRLGLGHAIEFLDNIKRWDELHLVYARADILLLPARFSNGNATIFEAMASGMGIVISDKVLANGKLVVDGVNGFNCPPDVDAFFERVQRYIDSPGLFVAHAIRNRAIVAKWSAKETAKDVARILDSRIVGCA